LSTRFTIAGRAASLFQSSRQQRRHAARTAGYPAFSISGDFGAPASEDGRALRERAFGAVHLPFVFLARPRFFNAGSKAAKENADHGRFRAAWLGRDLEAAERRSLTRHEMLRLG
jgi:hypothetical protein